jgi:two-component system LytT family sensor kinase
MAISLKSKFTVVLLHILVWVTLLSLPYIFNFSASNTPDSSIPCSLFTIINLVNILLFYLNVLFLSPRFYDKQKKLLYLFLIIIALTVFSIIKVWIISTFYNAFINNAFVNRFTFFSGILLLLASIVYCMVVTNIKQEQENKMKQAEQLSVQLKFLRSQINPHFLFNVLTSLVSLARKKSDNLESSLIMLSDIMRYMLYESDGKKVAISKEIEYLKSYIELQKLRFGNNVKIETHINATGESHTIEPMLLIPFVENAFKHGTGWVENAVIEINLILTGEVLIFDVKNKYNPSEKSKDTSSGIGLANVQSRLDLLYPGKHKLICNKENDLFHVKLTLQVE